MPAEVLAGALAASAVVIAAAAVELEWYRAHLELGAAVNSRSPDDSGRVPGSRPWARRRRPAKRVDVVQGQLADAASALAAACRAGLSVPQAIGVAADQTADPVGASMREIAERTDLGSSLDDALDRWTVVIPMPDVRLVAAVLRLHRRTGGALPDALDRLARTLRERRSIVREARSLTAQARLSGAILGLLPVGFFVFLVITSRGDMVDALSSAMGRTSIAVGLILEGVAFLWIRQLLRLEP